MRFLLSILAAFVGTLAALFFLVLLVVALVAAQDPSPQVERDSVLVLDLSGSVPETQPLDPFAEAFSPGAVTLREVTEALEKAAVDERIRAVWLKPGGISAAWATASELRQALVAYRASGKPLIASGGADGYGEVAYYLATAADSIFSAPEAGFELNGLYVGSLFFGGALERYRIEPVVVRAGDFKSAAENITERRFSPENREQYAALLRTFDEQLRSTIAEARGLQRGAIDGVIAEGGIYTARDALAFGLLDALRYDHEVEDALRAYTGQNADDDLRTVSLRTYRRITRRDAGLSPGNRRNRVAVIYASGPIMSGTSGGSGFGGEVLGSETFVEAIRDAQRDDRVRAIVVRVDSPGGSATASDAMWAAVRSAAQDLPVVVSMGSVAASGGYYIAAPAHAIVAEPATITGSIGVIGLLLDATPFLENQFGITVDSIRTGPAAGLYSLPVTQQEVQILQRQVDSIYDTFVSRVAEGRGLPEDSVRALGGGRVWSGRDALARGLVDRLGTLDDAIRLAAERAELEPDDYQLLVLPRRAPLFERLAEQFGTATLRFRPAPTSAERLLRAQAARLDELTRTSGTPLMRMVDELVFE